MPKRSLRVIKWLGTTPVVAVCAFCGEQFKAPMSSLSKTADAQANLQRQFDAHECKPADCNENALGVTREDADDK